MRWNEEGVHGSVRMARGVAHRGPARPPRGCAAPQHVESPTPTGGTRPRRGSPIWPVLSRKGAGRDRQLSARLVASGPDPQTGGPGRGDNRNQVGRFTGSAINQPPGWPQPPPLPAHRAARYTSNTSGRPAWSSASNTGGPNPTSRSQPPRRPTRCWARASRSNTGRRSRSLRTGPPRAVGRPVEQLVQPTRQLVEPRIVELPSRRISAANRARSAQSRRALGFALRAGPRLLFTSVRSSDASPFGPPSAPHRSPSR